MGNDAFLKERLKLDEQVMGIADKNIKRFYNLDSTVYKNGVLSALTKEMLGLVSSLVLRCEDCIRYHINQCFNLGISDEELSEIFSVGLIVGGSIVIPHLRKATGTWNELKVNAKNNFDKKSTLTFLQNQIDIITKSSDSKEKKMQEIVVLLDRFIPYYDWTGFYLSDSEQKKLVLGKFVGEPTDHKIIPFGKGICGQSAETKEVTLVDDVLAEENYLACSLKVKSEIVVPILSDTNIFLGELDIDSHKKEAFTQEDEIFLKEICQKIAKIF